MDNRKKCERCANATPHDNDTMHLHLTVDGTFEEPLLCRIHNGLITWAENTCSVFVEKLRPCPACGGEARVHTYADVKYRSCVTCRKGEDCGVTGPYCDTEDDAIEAWNSIRLAKPEQPDPINLAFRKGWNKAIREAVHLCETNHDRFVRRSKENSGLTSTSHADRAIVLSQMAHHISALLRAEDDQ
jgi:hypothetical protein